MIRNLSSAGTLQKTIDVYKNNPNVVFLRDLIIDLLVPISSNQEAI